MHTGDVFPLFFSDSQAYVELVADTGRPRLARAFFSRGAEHIVLEVQEVLAD